MNVKRDSPNIQQKWLQPQYKTPLNMQHADVVNFRGGSLTFRPRFFNHITIAMAFGGIVILFGVFFRLDVR